MRLDNLPNFVMTRLLKLEQQCRDAKTAAHDIADNLANTRMVLAASSNPPHVLKAASEQLPKLTAEMSSAELTLDHLNDVVERCREWIDRLPDNVTLEKYVPKLPAEDAGNPTERLDAIRKRLKAANEERTRLENIPDPSVDIKQRIEQCVAALAGKPQVSGMADGANLRISWPGAGMTSTGLDQQNCSPLQMFATLFPEKMVELAMASVEATCGSPQEIELRYARLDELDAEFKELERRASDLVRAIISRGGNQGFGSAPPAAILGVRVAQKEKAAA